MKLSLTLSLLLVLFAGGCGETSDSTNYQVIEKDCDDFIEVEGKFIEETLEEREFDHQKFRKICRSDFPEGGVALSCEGSFYVQHNDFVYVSGLEKDLENDDWTDDYIFFIKSRIAYPDSYYRDLSPDATAYINIEKERYRYRGLGGTKIISSPKYEHSGSYSQIDIDWELDRTDLTIHEEYFFCSRTIEGNAFTRWKCNEDSPNKTYGSCKIVEGDFLKAIKINYEKQSSRGLQLKKERLKKLEKEKEKIKI